MKTTWILVLMIVISACAACSSPGETPPTAAKPATVPTSTPGMAIPATVTFAPTATLTPTATGAQVVVNYSTDHRAGPIAILRYALTNPSGEDIYPLGEGAIALYGLYDTGSNHVRISTASENRLTIQNWGNSDAGHLKLSKEETVNLRLNGLQTEDINGNVPIGAPGSENSPQVDVGAIAVRPDETGVTLIGAPVVNRVVAHLNFSNKIIGLFSKLETIEVNLYNPSDANIPAVDIWLPLEQIDEQVSAEDATAGRRYWLRNVTFQSDGKRVSDQTDGLNFMFDTATTLTVVNDVIAEKLDLSSRPASFNCFRGQNNGYFIDSVQMTGAEGTYQLNNIAICWKADVVEAGDALIGTNFFDKVQIVVDGPNARLGIKQ